MLLLRLLVPVQILLLLLSVGVVAPDVVVEDVGFGSYVAVVAKSVGVVAAFDVDDCASFVLLGES